MHVSAPGGGLARPRDQGDRRGRRPRRGPRRHCLSKSVAKARIPPGCAKGIVDIPRFFSPPILSRSAFATDLDTPPPRTAPGAPPAPQPYPPTRTITPIPASPEGFLVRKASMMPFLVRTARSCTRKSAREPPSPSRRPLPGMRRTRSSLDPRARHLTREHVPLADVLAG